MEPTNESGLVFDGGVDIQQEFLSKTALEGDSLARYINQKLESTGNSKAVMTNLPQIDNLAQDLWLSIPDDLKNTQWFSELPTKPMFYGLSAPANDLFGTEKVYFANNPELPDDLSGFFVFNDAYFPFVMEKDGAIDIHGFKKGEFPELSTIIRAEAILRYVSCLSHNDKGGDEYTNILKDNMDTLALLRGNVTDLIPPQSEKEDVEITKRRLASIEEIFSEDKFSPIIQSDHAVSRRGWMSLGSRQKSNNWMVKGNGYVASMNPTHTSSDITSLMRIRNTRFLAGETNSNVTFSMEIAGTIMEGTMNPSGQVNFDDEYIAEFPRVAEVIKTQVISTYINMLIARGEAIADPSLQKFKESTLTKLAGNTPMDVRQEFVDKLNAVFTDTVSGLNTATTFSPTETLETQTQENTKSETPTPEKPENEAITKLFAIEKKLEELSDIIPVDRKKLLGIAGGFRKTYANLIPNAFQNAKWQQDPGHTVRMDDGTFNRDLGLQEVRVVSYPGSEMLANGTGTFILGMGDNNEPLWGIYNFKNGKITVGKPEDQSLVNLSESDNPLLYNFVADNVLGAYLTVLIGQGDVNSEVARHQLTRTKEYRINNSRDQLALSLFNNTFPPIYALMLEGGMNDIELEAENHTEAFGEFSNRIEQIQSAIPPDTTPITALFNEYHSLAMLFKEFDGAEGIAFLADTDSENLIFLITGEKDTTAFISGKITKLGDIVDFDLDLSKYPHLKEFFKGFVITKYVELLKEHGIVTTDAEIDEQYLFEPLKIKGSGKDILPPGTFDEIEANVREDQQEGEDVKRLATRLGYEQFLLSQPELLNFIEYPSRSKRRLWADLPQRFKSGRWMEEGKVYAAASYAARVKELRDVDHSYLFTKDAQTGKISFIKVDGDVGADPPAILNDDGTVVFEQFDREKYPDAYIIEESSAVEAYAEMLQENGQSRIAQSTLKSLARLRRDYHDITERFYQLSDNDEMFEKYLESIQTLNQETPTQAAIEEDLTRANAIKRYERMEELYKHEPYSEILELSDTKRRRMWLDIPQRLKSGRWMEEGKAYNCDRFTIKGEQLGGVIQTLVFEREPETGKIVGTLRRDTEGKILNLVYELQDDGTVQVREHDREKFPLVFKAEDAILVEAFYRTLEQEGQIKMSDNLYRQLSSLDRRIDLVKRTYKASHPEWTGTIQLGELDSSMQLPVVGNGQEEQDRKIETSSIEKQDAENSPTTIETNLRQMREIISNYRTGRNTEVKNLALAQAELHILGIDDPKLLLTYLDFAFKNATGTSRNERRDGVRLIHTFGTYLDKLEPGSYEKLLAKGHQYMKDHKDEPYGIRRLLERAKADGTLTVDVPPKLLDFLNFVTKAEAERDTNEYTANYNQIIKYFDNLPDEQKTEISNAIKKAKRQIWDALPPEYQNTNWLTDSKEYFQKIKGEQFAQVLSPFDHFFIATDKNYPDTRGKFAAILLREGETTSGIPLVVDKFGRVEFQFPVDESPMSNLIGLAAIISYINIMQGEQRLPQDDKVIELVRQHMESISILLQPPESDELIEKQDTLSVSENLEEQNKRAYEAYTEFLRHEIPIGILPESHELTISKIRRLWVNVPQQFKNSRWIKEGEAFHSKQFDEGTTVDFERAGVTNLEFKRNLENTDSILFQVQVGDNKLIGTLNSDGTISLPGVDETDEWIPEVRGGIVESYFVMLTEQKKAFYDKSLITFIERHKQKLQALSDSLQTSEDNSSPARFESAQNLDMTAVGNANGEIADHLTPEKLERTAIDAVKKYDEFFDNLNEEERARVFALSDEVRKELWSLIPTKSQENADVSEFDNVLTVPLANPELLTFVEPLNLFVVASHTNNENGFLLGFGNNDLTDAVVFDQEANGEMNFRPILPDTVGVRFAKYIALYLYADAQKARGKFGDTIFPPELKKKNDELTSLFYKAIRSSEEKGVGQADDAYQNPSLFYRQDTGQSVSLQEITVKPGMKSVYDNFVARHKGLLWNFVPDEYKTSSRIEDGKRIRFGLGLGGNDDPYKDAIFSVRRPSDTSDNRLFFMLSNPKPSISGFINSDGTIDVPGLDSEKYHDGLSFLNLNVLQWYLGGLEDTKIVDVAAFKKYWEGYTKEREILLDCLSNFDVNTSTQDTKSVQSHEKTPRRRLKPGEAGQELELVFDQILQSLPKTNTM